MDKAAVIYPLYDFLYSFITHALTYMRHNGFGSRDKSPLVCFPFNRPLSKIG